MEFNESRLSPEGERRDPLVEAYKLIHEKDPTGLREWEIARAVVEVLDDPNWISNELARECIYKITHGVEYPDDAARINIVLAAEEKAGFVFPELRNINEIHMDQIEYTYAKWKERNNNEKAGN